MTTTMMMMTMMMMVMMMIMMIVIYNESFQTSLLPAHRFIRMEMMIFKLGDESIYCKNI